MTCGNGSGDKDKNCCRRISKPHAEILEKRAKPLLKKKAMT